VRAGERLARLVKHTHDDSRLSGAGSEAELVLVSPSPSLGLAALCPVLFLNADEAKSATVLADDPGALDTLGEAAKKLIERFRISDLYMHTVAIPPFP
jgi:hypothetical protein